MYEIRLIIYSAKNNVYVKMNEIYIYEEYRCKIKIH